MPFIDNAKPAGLAAQSPSPGFVSQPKPDIEILIGMTVAAAVLGVGVYLAVKRFLSLGMGNRWARGTVIAAIAWPLLIAIFSATVPHNTFAWFSHGGLGAASIVTIAGIALIILIGLGTPWVMKAKRED